MPWACIQHELVYTVPSPNFHYNFWVPYCYGIIGFAYRYPYFVKVIPNKKFTLCEESLRLYIVIYYSRFSACFYSQLRVYCLFLQLFKHSSVCLCIHTDVEVAYRSSIGRTKFSWTRSGDGDMLSVTQMMTSHHDVCATPEMLVELTM